jgi:hypothetical protein
LKASAIDAFEQEKRNAAARCRAEIGDVRINHGRPSTLSESAEEAPYVALDCTLLPFSRSQRRQRKLDPQSKSVAILKWQFTSATQVFDHTHGRRAFEGKDRLAAWRTQGKLLDQRHMPMLRNEGPPALNERFVK